MIGSALRSCLPALMIASLSCSCAASLRGRTDALAAIIAKAEEGGAMRCTPRELALAKAHAAFASMELEQGSPSEAENHLAIAEPNAHAALANTQVSRCTEHRADDRDNDGIVDHVDKCPDTPENYNGFEDADGCPDDPDTDKDGVPDSRDACQLDPEDRDGYLDDDGCPEPDNDLDGIPDAADKCPMQPEDPDGFQDDDGCPDPDNDSDSVPDVEDQCPNTPGQPGGPRTGCPQLIVVTAKEIRITQQIQFEFNKAAVRAVSFPILDAVADVLAANPKITIEVQGHTDNVGQAAYNLKLSGQRAEAVRAYLVGKGIEAKRLIAKGYGMTQPLLPNTSEGNRALNRRVQFIRTETP